MELNEALQAGLVRTLSELCFHFGDPAETSADRSSPYARVRLDGAWSGEFVIGIAPPLLQEFTENILGEESVSGEDCTNALLEIANVVCGNVLPELASSDDEFHLASPTLCSAERFDRPGEAPLAEAFMDEGAIMVRLFRDQAPTASEPS